MSGNLMDDVLAVWDDGAKAMPCDVLLVRLRELAPRSYAAWDALTFGRAMRISGAPTKSIRFAGGVRKGVTLASISEARQVHAQVVYFVERDGLVKIGTTANLPARLASLDRGSASISGMTIKPVTLLAVMPGGQPVEQAIHKLFAHLRHDGEWFLFDGALVPFVKSIADVGALWQR